MQSSLSISFPPRQKPSSRLVSQFFPTAEADRHAFRHQYHQAVEYTTDTTSTPPHRQAHPALLGASCFGPVDAGLRSRGDTVPHDAGQAGQKGAVRSSISALRVDCASIWHSQDSCHIICEHSLPLSHPSPIKQKQAKRSTSA